MSWKLVAFLVVCVHLVGCDIQERRRAFFESRCDGYGFVRGTVSYAQCWQTESMRDAAEWRRISADLERTYQQLRDERLRQQSPLPPPPIDTSPRTCVPNYGVGNPAPLLSVTCY